MYFLSVLIFYISEKGNQNVQGRLIYIGFKKYCHVNCAIWSRNVIEMNNGELKNVAEAKNYCKYSVY